MLLAQVVKCHGMSGLTEALEQDLSSPTVLLMHTQLEEGVGGTPAGLQAELQQVQAAHQAVAGLNKKQLTLYGVVPEAATLVQQRRLLANVQADVGTCGQLCQVSSWGRTRRGAHRQVHMPGRLQQSMDVCTGPCWGNMLCWRLCLYHWYVQQWCTCV